MILSPIVHRDDVRDSGYVPTVGGVRLCNLPWPELVALAGDLRNKAEHLERTRHYAKKNRTEVAEIRRDLAIIACERQRRRRQTFLTDGGRSYRFVTTVSGSAVLQPEGSAEPAKLNVFAREVFPNDPYSLLEIIYRTPEECIAAEDEGRLVRMPDPLGGPEYDLAELNALVRGEE